METKDSKQAVEGWSRVMDGDQVRRAITRISHEILERNRGATKLAIVGIRTRGETLSARIAQQIKEIENVEVPLGVVDITLYRDDIGSGSDQPVLRDTNFPFNVDEVVVVLVDDVLFTGRTVRAAIDALIDFGRPIGVQLAVLMDRGHRELPIRADFIGKSIPTARDEVVEVRLTPVDEEDAVYVRKKSKKK